MLATLVLGLLLTIMVCVLAALLDEPRGKKYRCRPRVEGLELRLAPAQMAWTDGTGDGLASDPLNWTDIVYHTNHLPGSGDYVLYSNTYSASACTMDLSLSVDRVDMSGYTGTLTVDPGVTLATANYFTQYGTLDLIGSAAVEAQGNVYVYGTVSTGRGMGPPTTATLSSAASFYIYYGATTATASGSGATSLKLSAGSFDDAGILDVGIGGATPAAGAMTIAGDFVETSAGTITVAGGSVLTFTTGGNSGANVDLKGTLTLAADGLGVAGVVNASEPLWMDGGTLGSTGGSPMTPKTISGDVDVYNDGSMNLGTTTAPASALSLTGGSLTIGAQAAGLSPTGGTLNLNTGSDLLFPAAAGVTSTFLVSGGTSPATVNMNGAAITMAVARVATLEVSGGTLNSNGGGGMGDVIAGNLSVDNAGTLNVGTTTTANVLTVDGSVTVGAQAPGQTSTGGTVNDNTGSTLSVPGAMGGGSTFVVQGSSAVVNMFGAGITVGGVPSLDLEGGVLNTDGTSTGGGDLITGSLTNNGTVSFGGSALHTLTVTAAYAQGSNGTLDERLANGSNGTGLSDVLAIGGAATLDGTVNLSGQGLNGNQTWTVLTTGGGIIGNFSTIDFPNDNGVWGEQAIGNVIVHKN
jgi:fibronectin-binding autotransporter adhesin